MNDSWVYHPFYTCYILIIWGFILLKNHRLSMFYFFSISFVAVVYDLFTFFFVFNVYASFPSILSSYAYPFLFLTITTINTITTITITPAIIPITKYGNYYFGSHFPPFSSYPLSHSPHYLRFRHAAQFSMPHWEQVPSKKKYRSKQLEQYVKFLQEAQPSILHIEQVLLLEK